MTHLKDHEIRELINKLRDIAIKYHAAQQLRDYIAYVVLDALKPERDKEPTIDRKVMQMALHAMHSAREFLATVEDHQARLQETRLHDAMREVRAALAQGEQTTSLEAFHTKLLASQEPLGAEAEKVLQDNLWDLYARSEDKND